MTFSVLVFFAGPTPLAMVVGGVAAIHAPTDDIHVCDVMGWPRGAPSRAQRTLTLRNATHSVQLVVDGPVTVITLLPAQLSPPPLGRNAGILACVIRDDGPTMMVLDINFLLARMQLASAAPVQVQDAAR